MQLPKTTKKKTIYNILKNDKTQGDWASIDRIRFLTNFKRSTIGRALRKLREEGKVISQKIPGKHHGRKQWTVIGPNQNVATVTTGSSPSTQPKGAAQPHSKGSVGSLPTMCRPANMPTLNKAVEGTVADFIVAKKKFSAYDVTKAIRNESNLGNCLIDSVETGTIYVGGIQVPLIKHSLVRECVHDIFNCGAMPGYGRVFNGEYMEYQEEDASDVAVVLVKNLCDTAPSDPLSDPGDDVKDGDDYDGTSPLNN